MKTADYYEIIILQDDSSISDAINMKHELARWGCSDIEWTDKAYKWDIKAELWIGNIDYADKVAQLISKKFPTIVQVHVNPKHIITLNIFQKKYKEVAIFMGLSA